MSLRLLTALIAAVMMAASPAAAHEWVDYFDEGEAVLSEIGYLKAREVAQWLPADPNAYEVTLHGHADRIEGKIPGQRYDLRRARAMMLELVRLGVSAGSVRIEVHGDTQLARMSEGSERLNRRVTVSVNLRSPRPRIDHSDQPVVYFKPGGTEILEDAEFALRVGLARYRPGASRVVIQAHADAAGSAEANQRLSDERAEAVARVVARHGVVWSDIEMTGHGETQRARVTPDGVAEPLNRRATMNVFRRPDAR